MSKEKAKRGGRHPNVDEEKEGHEEEEEEEEEDT